MKRVVIAGLVGGIAALAVVSGAFAGKPTPTVLPLDCGEDGIVNVVVVPGNGRYTPAKIVGGGVLIPVAFSNSHGTFTDNEGNTEEFSDPDVAKAGPTNKDFLNCHYEIAFEDENGTGHFEGDVKAFIAGA